MTSEGSVRKPIAIAAGMMLILATACTSTAVPPPASNGSGADQGPVTPKVNRVVLATAPPATESNDNRMIGQIDIVQLRPQNEFLIGFDAETGKFPPELATEWKLEPDGKSFRFKLRQGVQFHRGFGEFTAKDLVFTHDNLTLPDSTQVEAPYWKRVVKKIDIINDYEVVYNLDPDANFLHGISRAEGGMEVRSKESFGKIGHPSFQSDTLAGTGPYQYKERKQGEYLRFERFDGYWNKGKPEFPEFEFRYIREASTRLAGLLAGEIHLTPLPQDLLKNAESGGMKVAKGRVAGPRIALRPYGPEIKNIDDLNGPRVHADSPLGNVTVRKALQKAVNLEELNKSIFSGKGEIMYHDVLHPTRVGWDPKFEREYRSEYGYDPEAARRLLTEAGYSATKPLETNILLIELAQFPGTADVQEAVANYWRAIGVKVNLIQMDPVQRTASTRALRFDNHWGIDGTSSDVHIYLQTRWGPSFPTGTIVGHGGRDAEVTRQFLALRSELDEKKQDQLYRQIGEEGWRKHMMLNLLWLPAEVAYNPKIVADYVFPGAISGTWTHVENIKAAR